MKKKAKSVKELEAILDQRASANIRSALAWTLIPAAIALVILLYTANQVRLAQGDIAEAEEGAQVAQAELKTTQAEVARYQTQAQAATEKLQQIRNENETATKELAKTRSELADLSKQYVAAKSEIETALKAKKEAQADLKTAHADAENYRLQAVYLRKKLNELQQSLRESAKFVRNTVDLDWSIVKEIASHSPAAADLLVEIKQLQERNVGWGLRNTVADGFTSPGFAGFVLRELGRRREAGPLSATPPQAIRELPIVRQVAPQTGDLIVYETGYTMFYFEGPRRPFVLGMTPAGILALVPDFGPRRIGIYRTGL